MASFRPVAVALCLLGCGSDLPSEDAQVGCADVELSVPAGAASLMTCERSDDSLRLVVRVSDIGHFRVAADSWPRHVSVVVEAWSLEGLNVGTAEEGSVCASRPCDLAPFAVSAAESFPCDWGHTVPSFAFEGRPVAAQPMECTRTTIALEEFEGTLQVGFLDAWR